MPGAYRKIEDLPQIIDAVDMVGVVVGPDDRIHRGDIGSEELRAHVGTGVDQDARPLMLDQQRRARAPISRLGGIARSPIVADPRHA